MKLFSRQYLQKGFTLIELLVVIAVMGVLATIVLVAIDPAEQFNRAEDGNRKQTVNSLGNAVLQYVTSRASLASPELAEGTGWITAIKNAGELKQVPPASGIACASTLAENQYCYNLDGTNFTAWVILESKAEDNNTASGTACGTSTDTNRAAFIFDSSTGKTCKVCDGGSATYTPAAGACP